MVDDAAVEVDVEVQQVAAALEEVAPVGLGVEADDVVGEQPVEELLADLVRQHAPGIRLGPRDVDEVMQEHVGPNASQQGRQRVQVVVVDHHHGLGTPVDLLEHRVRQVLVDDVVAVLERLYLIAPHVRGVGEIPEVVLDEPQHRVREHVVAAMPLDLARSRDRLTEGLRREGFAVLESQGTYFVDLPDISSSARERTSR